VSAVQPQYGPSLLELLAARPLRVRLAAAAFALVLVAAAIVIALRSRPEETVILLRKPITFNFAHGPALHRVTQPGTLVTLRRSRDGRQLESFVVRDLMLPPYRGAVGGMLPVYADGYMRKLRRRYGGARLVSESRTRINNGVGYQVTFRGQRDARVLYIRHLLLVPELPDGQRRGVVLELETTFAAGTPNAEETGTRPQLKMPLRSFRFGEDREGGTT